MSQSYGQQSDVILPLDVVWDVLFYTDALSDVTSHFMPSALAFHQLSCMVTNLASTEQVMKSQEVDLGQPLLSPFAPFLVKARIVISQQAFFFSG